MAEQCFDGWQSAEVAVGEFEGRGTWTRLPNPMVRETVGAKANPT